MMATPYYGFGLRNRPPGFARSLNPALPEGLRRNLENAEAAIAKPFTGVTSDGQVVPGLFPMRATGVSARPIREAADRFLASLPADRRKGAQFERESDAWRRWSNIHPFLMRHGVSLEDLDTPQRDRALDLLAATLSASGLATARDVMRLNETVREVTGRDDEYGEWPYWVSIFGTPSDDAPWGWQIDGHHLIVNCFVLGDQVVTTPLFMGSEPVRAETGKYAGVRVFEQEEAGGLGLVQQLNPSQRKVAIVSDELPGELFTAAFRDNFEIAYQGIRAEDLSAPQRDALVGLIGTYVRRMRPGHDQVRLDEVKRRLNATHFAWMGGTAADSVFYYRIHSPVILIEFDHQRGIVWDNDMPSRNHIHTVVRTPNGNDYGKDLLRQHHEQVRH